eukprot:m.122090 g.122090  ORF g.122090 m.122090 type:complete len:167 (+) comp52111_c0_seq11:211-711(+)
MDKKVNALTQGPPMEGMFDCGAMTMGPQQIVGIQALIDDAVASGARLLAGGRTNPAYSTGSFLLPTLLVDVTTEMKIAQKEVSGFDMQHERPVLIFLGWRQVFGPVMVIMRAQNDDDALRIVRAYCVFLSLFVCVFSCAFLPLPPFLVFCFVPFLRYSFVRFLLER